MGTGTAGAGITPLRWLSHVFGNFWDFGGLGFPEMSNRTSTLGFSSMGLSQDSQKSCMIDAFPLIESAVNDVYKRTRHKVGMAFYDLVFFLSYSVG